MPSSPGDDPRTPDRRSSSSTLLSAFRTLTSVGRPKSTSQAALFPPSLTPIQPAFSKTELKKETIAQRALSENGSLVTASHTRITDADARSIQTAFDVVGGPPELARLLPQLDKTRPLTERIQVAHKISSALDQYRIRNPLVIWSAGSDLLVHDSQNASRAGHTLLVSCARASELSAMERSVLFDSIHSLKDDRHIDLRFQALVELTSKGRNVESLEIQLAPFIARLLLANYNVVSRVRKKEKKAKSAAAAKEEASFDGMFQYIVDVTKFNAKVFQENDFALLLDQVIAICRRTTSESDIANSTNVINALITYTQVPVSSIRPCLELLGDVFRQVKALKTPTWNALRNIFRSHLGQTAMLTYMDVLQKASTDYAENKNNIRGAFKVLSQLFRKDGKNGLPVLPLSLFLPAIRSALETKDRTLAEDVMLHFRNHLFHEDLLHVLEKEHEWEELVDTIVYCWEILALSTPNRNGSPVEKESDAQSVQSGREEETQDPSEALDQIIQKLSIVFPMLDLLHKDAVVSLFLQLSSKLSDSAAEILVTQCAEDGLLYPSNADWFGNCKKLISSYLHDQHRPRHLRVLVASVLKDAYATIEPLSDEKAAEFAILTLEKMNEETDTAVLEALAGFAVAVVDRADDELFESILSILRTTIFQRRPSINLSQNLSPPAGPPIGLPSQTQPSLCRTAAKHIIRMFIANVNTSATKAEALYNFILQIARSNDCATDARICAVKLLFRLRATSDYAIWIRPLSESESVAAVLCRTAESANWIQAAEDAAARDTRNISSGSAKQKSFNVKRPVPPLWFYPGFKGLPEEPPPEPSQYMYSYSDADAEDAREGTKTLKLTHWLETVIDLLQQPETDWELYSYVVVHLGAQLANQNLFRAAIPQVKFLRNVLCDQIRAASFHDPPSYTSLKKADVAVCLFHVLTMLVPYHAHFAKSEEDEVVRAFILGIGSWDRTSKWCIHALSICCHELPLSVSKSLDSIIQKMSQIITQSQIAIHILEFLVMLARLPELYKNFREDEYKMVFGVSFRYLQYVRDQQEREKDKEKEPAQPSSRPGRAIMRHSDSFRELRMLTDQDIRPKGRSPSDDLPQYVYALAFHVITFWFMNLKLQDRPMYMPWIAKNLTYTDKDGIEHIEDQGLVTMDMMDKIAYSDRDETAHDPHFTKETDGEVSQRTWIIGYSLLTIETAGRTGMSQLTRRRPSGTKYFTYRPMLTSPPRHQVPLTTGLAADAFYTSSYIGVLPEDVLQEFYSSYNLLDTKSPRPIPLPEDDTVRRAIGVFDLNSTVDGHKVGVIYIGEGQTAEADILANTYGSADYTSFIGGLGFLTRLKNAQFNTQGLDRSGDTDGQYTYCWRDRATEIVFHLTTMMPTNKKHDPRCTKKKSHIGNDLVNIVWNDSGHPFKFDSFPSAYNYVYIVITPETAHSFTALRNKDNPPKCFYNVHVVSAPGFPEISPAAEAKVVSAKALPTFVRLLALNASVFALVWANREGGEHFSPWRNRLREIKRLRAKYGGQMHSLPFSYSGSSPSPVVGSGQPPPSTSEKAASDAAGGKGLVSPLSSQSRERGSSALSNRISMATFSGSDNVSRSSLTPSSAEDRAGNDTDHE